LKKFFFWIVQGLLGVFFILVLIYFILPKGFLLLWGLNKLGIKAIAKEVKENLLGADFYGVVLDIRGENLNFPKVHFKLNKIKLICGNGKVYIRYVPGSKVKVNIENLKGSCVGENRFKEVRGDIVYRIGKGLFGELEIKGVKYGIKASKVFLRLKGNNAELYVPQLGIRQSFKIRGIL